MVFYEIIPEFFVEGDENIIMKYIIYSSVL